MFVELGMPLFARNRVSSSGLDTCITEHVCGGHSTAPFGKCIRSVAFYHMQHPEVSDYAGELNKLCSVAVLEPYGMVYDVPV